MMRGSWTRVFLSLAVLFWMCALGEAGFNPFECPVGDPVDPPLPYHMYACKAGSPGENLPFCNISLEVEDRISDLISRIPPDQRQLWTSEISPINEELGIPSYNYTLESQHAALVLGIGASNFSTFPNGIGMSASFNRSAWSRAGFAVGRELRAANENHAVPAGVFGGGFSTFGPNVNIGRDPRWGRIQEVPGEDPFLSGEYGSAYIRGVRGMGSAHAQMSVGVKHIDAYSLEAGVSDGQNYSRKTFDAIVSSRDLFETYLPAFQAIVQSGNADALMCSYIAVNHIPACANAPVLNDIVRDEWGFRGYIVADKGALWSMHHSHNFSSSYVTAAAAALRGGCDQAGSFCYAKKGTFYNRWIPRALKKGLVTQDDVDLAMRRQLRARYATGAMDPPETVPYSSLSMDVIGSTAHRELNKDVARQSLVLLKNNNRVLPLSKTVKVALIGPIGNATTGLEGDYGSISFPVVSMQAAFKSLGIDFTWAVGCPYVDYDTSYFSEAIQAAENADVVVFALGLSAISDPSKNIPYLEGEFVDREELTLPDIQRDLVKNVTAAVKRKPTVAVLVNGGPLAVPGLKDNIDAIVEAFYPGQYGGTAIADGLFGDFAICGRLPYTVYPANYVNEIAMTNMNITTPPGRTYKYYRGTPLWPFGFGLSYTNFTYVPVSFPEEEGMAVKAGESVSFQYNVTNNGPMDSSLFVSFQPLTLMRSNGPTQSLLAFFEPNGLPDGPKSVLISFEKIFLRVGETKTVFLFISPEMMSVHHSSLDGHSLIRAVFPGRHRVSIGAAGLSDLSVPLRVEGFYKIRDFDKEISRMRDYEKLLREMATN